MESAVILIISVLIGWYVFTALLILYGLKRASSGRGAGFPAELPAVSVVAAVRDEENNIIDFLESLVKQDYPRLEIIIVDDNSQDDTRVLAEDFCRGITNIRIIPAGENTRGWGPKKNALHSGICSCNGEIILTTDADCRPEPGWVKNIAAEFTEGTGAVVGYSPLRFSGGLTGRLKSLEALASAVVSAGFIGLGKPFLAVGRNLAYRKDLYLRIGGFGESGRAPAGDDDLLLQSMAKLSKVKYSFSREAQVPSYPERGGYIARKRRHFAVVRHYPSLFIALGVMVYLLLLGMTAAMIFGLICGSSELFLAGSAVFIIKILIDGVLLKTGGSKLGDNFNFVDMLAAELVHIPYTLALQPLSFIGRLKWRGRTL